VLKGAGGDQAMHCVPPVADRRISITLRRWVAGCLAGWLAGSGVATCAVLCMLCNCCCAWARRARQHGATFWYAARRVCPSVYASFIPYLTHSLHSLHSFHNAIPCILYLIMPHHTTTYPSILPPSPALHLAQDGSRA
jgi:hypothetical protein